MSNPVKKVHFSVTFLLITFFWYIFSKLFQRIRNQHVSALQYLSLFAHLYLSVSAPQCTVCFSALQYPSVFALMYLSVSALRYLSVFAIECLSVFALTKTVCLRNAVFVSLCLHYFICLSPYHRICISPNYTVEYVCLRIAVSFCLLASESVCPH